MGFLSVASLLVLLVVTAKAWRYWVETTGDLEKIRAFAPWFWFLFLNLALSLISSNYDYSFVGVGLLVQLILSFWFALSMRWWVKDCPHKSCVMRHSWFSRGKNLKFCYQCGTRLPKDFHSHMVKSVEGLELLFPLPPALLEYVAFSFAQSLMVLVSLFFVLKFLHDKSQLQNKAILIVVVLALLAPPGIYFWRRFRNYLGKTGGLIWWEDFSGSFLTWAGVLAFLWLLWRFG